MLHVDNLTRSMKGRTLLDACSLSIKPGSFLAVVGANGAGKSTLLRMVSGELKPTSGHIQINELPLKTFTPKSLSRIRATLPQHTSVSFPFTVEQVVEIGRFPHATSKDENEQIVGKILKRTGLIPFAKRTYQTLSGGEQQRVHMARVMAQLWGQQKEPRYLLLDEPTSSLDLAQQQRILSQAASLKQENIGVMAILHDLNLALQFADHILFLKHGKTIAYGDIEEVVNQEVIEETYDHPVRILQDGNHRIIVPDSVGRHTLRAPTQNTTWCRSCPAFRSKTSQKLFQNISPLNTVHYGKFRNN